MFSKAATGASSLACRFWCVNPAGGGSLLFFGINRIFFQVISVQHSIEILMLLLLHLTYSLLLAHVNYKPEYSGYAELDRSFLLLWEVLLLSGVIICWDVHNVAC
mmetsp:Transcript_43301/g.74976  ORF Transcript_43301/g.74976 Transcript_43301/m.74976 type:complete len:105 (+) Transcript_43301:296-610(+)